MVNVWLQEFVPTSLFGKLCSVLLVWLMRGLKTTLSFGMFSRSAPSSWSWLRLQCLYQGANLSPCCLSPLMLSSAFGSIFSTSQRPSARSHSCLRSWSPSTSKVLQSTPTLLVLARYKLLAGTMVDEMRIMRMNVLRWKAVHDRLFGTDKKDSWIVPNTLKEFEEETKWTHVLSARLVPIAHLVLLFY